MTESQRQSVSNHPNSSQQTSRESLPLPKKKHIKKEHFSAQNQPKLTKEERTKLQKQKNREAAQRSRDQHKQYVTRLQCEVRQLRVQVQCNKNFCFRCRQELDASYFAEAIKDEEILDIQIFPEELGPQQPADRNDSMLPPQDDVADFFLRAKEEPQEESSYLKMMLFVAMIVVAILIYPTGNEGRKLVELYQTPVTHSNLLPQDQSPSNLISNYHSENNGAIAPYSFDKKCLESLVNTGRHQYSNLRTTDSYRHNGGLICSYEGLSHTWSSSEGKQSLVNLFLVGGQVQQLMTTHSKISRLISDGLQLNGIYQLTADVRSIELVSRHNCLL